MKTKDPNDTNMKRPNEYLLHTTLLYFASTGDGTVCEQDLRKYAEQAEKLEKYIDFLEGKLLKRHEQDKETLSIYNTIQERLTKMKII
jgi:hypothetical protein